MTPNDFIAKWHASELKERSASQEHFIDLCRLLREPTPAEANPTGETYCFERGARKLSKESSPAASRTRTAGADARTGESGRRTAVPRALS